MNKKQHENEEKNKEKKPHGEIEHSEKITKPHGEKITKPHGEIEQPSQTTRRIVNIGTIGHIDHGKSELVKALTGGNPDGDREEKQRGITIKAKFFKFISSGRVYSIVDCPGHSDYVKNMITGSAAMDYAILVVAITDSVMPQTREHLALARTIGVKRVIVFVNKIDVYERENSDFYEIQKEVVEAEIKEILKENEYLEEDREDGVEQIYYGSALKAVESKSIPKKDITYKDEKYISNILNIMINGIDKFPIPKHDDEKPFLMWIGEVFTKSGRGTVVTGHVSRGTLKEGDKVEIVGIVPKVIQSSVAEVQSFNEKQKILRSGDNAAILLRGVTREQIKRGMVLAIPGSVKSYTKFYGRILISKGEGARTTPFSNNYRPQFFFSTADVTGKITLPKEVELVMPGDDLEVRVELIKPLAIESEVRFIIREGGKTVGWGIVNKTVLGDWSEVWSSEK